MAYPHNRSVLCLAGLLVQQAGFLLRNTTMRQRLERDGMGFTIVHEDAAEPVAAASP